MNPLPPRFVLRARASLNLLATALFRHDGALYTAWAAVATLASARSFYGYMLKQTGGEWSAPLDDVFIHFDYARSTALGHPFEWVVGNGYSSGNTSLLYPFVLAAGYAGGMQGERLMVWAAIVASVSVFGMLLAARRFFVDGPGLGGPLRNRAMRAASFLLPAVVLGVGALDWSLWSGMEVALFLGTWALSLVAWRALDASTTRSAPGRAWLLGAMGALMVLTRPEAATTIAVLGIASGLTLRRRIGFWRAVGVVVRVGVPAVAVLVVQAVANRVLTGESSANGAIVKLALNSPFMTPDEKLADYLFNLKYAALRNVEYHFTDAPGFGLLMPALALAAIAVPATRRDALVLWAQIAGWLLVVAFNGQVRWQNERYIMPAVAWLLVAATLGAGALLHRTRGRPGALLTLIVGALALQALGVATRPPNTAPEIRFAWTLAAGAGCALVVLLYYWPARVLAVGCALYFAHVHQEHNWRGQRWFFGRASRNIRDQHIVAGRWLAHLKPRRILVGDAGALLYASDRPGLDIIGLGGFRNLPFARAGLHGLPATIELIERLAPADRPDVFAIFPTWWGVLPTWFSSDVLARFPVEGNVICGGYEDVIYRADWHLLGTGEAPRHLPPGESVRDSVDVADLVSEPEHAYVFPSPGGGWTDMKILGDTSDDAHAHSSGYIFDGGRRIAAGRSESFTLRNLTAGRAAHVIVRSAPEATSRVFVRVGGAPLVELDFERTDGWIEAEAEVPGDRVGQEISVEMWNQGPSDFIDYHVWVTQ